jgi:hypothetical protein
LLIRRLGWVYAAVRINRKAGRVTSYGILVFDEDGKLSGELIGKDTYKIAPSKKGIEDQVKKIIMQEIQGDLEETAGVRYEIDPNRIILVGKKTFEKIAKKAGSLYYEDVERYRNVKRPLTVFFSPFRSYRSPAVKSKHVLVVDVEGRVVEHWEDPGGWTIGYLEDREKRLTTREAKKILKEFLYGHGLELKSGDRIYRLPPRAMENKLRQFGIESEDLTPGP